MSKILLVEDSALNRDMTTQALVEAGHTVITAIDGQDGLDKARSEDPELILLDVMLPKLDGYHVCRMLKYDENFKNIPIIMLTSRGEQSDQATGEQVGADAYCVKSGDFTGLLQTVTDLLK